MQSFGEEQGVKSEPAAIMAFASELSAAVLSFGKRQVEVRRLLEITDFPADVPEKFAKFEQQIAEGG